MKLVFPKETETEETRAALVPEQCARLVKHGAEIWIQAGLGAGCGIGDERYEAAGARVASERGELFAGAGVVLRVRKPPVEELQWLEKGTDSYQLSGSIS